MFRYRDEGIEVRVERVEATVRWTEASASASIPGELLPVLLEELRGTSLVTLFSIHTYSPKSETPKALFRHLYTLVFGNGRHAFRPGKGSEPMSGRAYSVLLEGALD